MDHQNQRATPPRSSSSHQFHPSRTALIDLFNLYLGVSRTLRPKNEDASGIRESPKKMQRRVTAPSRDFLPPNEQFLLDFEKLRGQFQDQDQLRMTLESVLVSFIVQCADHTPKAEFMLYALRVLCSIDYVNWDTFLLSLLSTVFALETSGGQGGSQSMMPSLPSTNLVTSGGMITLPSSGILNSTNFNGSNITFTPHLSSSNGIVSPTHSTIEHSDGAHLLPVKTSDAPGSSQRFDSRSGISNSTNFNGSNITFTPHLSSSNGIVSPTHSTIEHSDGAYLLPVKASDAPGSSQRFDSKSNQSSLKENHIRQISCKIILIGLDFNLKPFTHAEIFSHMLIWLSNWDQSQVFDEGQSRKEWKPRGPLNQRLHICLDVVWMLVDEERCRVPFYELLRSGLQFLGNTLDDVALFSLILEIHRRRDMVAMHMQMLDQNLHCPSFGTHRVLFHTHASISGEAVPNLRHSPITFPSVLGEPLYGEDIAVCIPKGSMDWERAMRCLRHALCTAPSPDWWRRVLILAPCYRQHPQQMSYPGAVFSSAMVCEAVIDRTIELLNLVYSDIDCWHEWLSFADIFYFLIKSACIDFIDFINKLSSRVTKDGQQIPRTNHVTWLLAQIIRLEIAANSLSVDPRNRLATDSRNVDTARKMISVHKEDKNSDTNNVTAQSTLLDFVSSSQALRFWSFNHLVRDYLSSDQLQKGKKIDDWWKQVTKDQTLDFMNLDDKSLGMLWVLSFTMAHPVCEAVINWLTSAGVAELAVTQNVQSNDRIMIMNETCPLPMKLLSGLSINLCSKLYTQLEDTIFLGQVIPSIAMVETYVRLLLVAPYSIFRPHFSSLTAKSSGILTKTWVLLLLLEILNYRLFSLYRYFGKNKALMYDVTKIIGMIKGKRGEHRTFRLAENLCMNLILSIRDFFVVKKDLKGPSEFTETLNRITIISLSITIKTRGIADVDHMLRLQSVLEQLMSTSQHTWSEKTMRHFPQLIRDFLIGRMDRRAQTIQAWKQAETTVIKQCTQLLSPTTDPKYVTTYIGHSFPQHRQYLCSGAWILMSGHPENINSANLGCVLREFSPEEVTGNIYTMVDVLLHHIQIELQHGHTLQDLLSKASTNLASLVLQHELLPLDILLLALIDRDDDPYALRIVLNMLERQELQQKVKIFCSIRGSPDHWIKSGVSKRIDLQKALGNHLSWKDRYPTFFDDIPARLLPVIPLIVYRLIENDATDAADRVLNVYSPFLTHHPLRFSFVRDILAYFYGNLPSKLILRILHVLDISKIPLSASFPQHVGPSNPASCPPPEYFITLLLGLVNNVIPSITSKSKPGTTGGTSGGFSREPPAKKTPATSQLGSPSSDGRRSFYQNQDPGTYTQFVLETAVIEILSLPVTTSQIVSSLVQIIEHIQSTLIQSNNGLLGLSGSQSNGLPTSPSGASAESLGTPRSNNSAQGISVSGLMSKTGYSWQQLSCLMIQACGLLLAQLPVEFHLQLYSEASRVIKECWWLADGKRSAGELETSVGYALLDPSCASQENTSTAIGNTVALLHSFFSNLPQEWLESTQTLIKNLRPVTSVATLRILFRIMGPLMPRLGFVCPVFFKIVALLFNCMADLFGKNTQTSVSVEASEITDIIDFLHHIVLYEGQGGPVQSNSKPKVDTLTLCGKAIDMLRPDVQHLLSHLRTDPKSSIYAATHPVLSQNLT